MKDILSQLPYTRPFLFVDEIIRVNEEQIKGTYHFSPEEFFYQGHFKDNPVTPGVILTECCAQIGLACFGIFLIKQIKQPENLQTPVVLTQSEMMFAKPVFPNTTVIVQADKIYFRFGKLKVKVEMRNEANQLICKGILAGMQNLQV